MLANPIDDSAAMVCGTHRRFICTYVSEFDTLVNGGDSPRSRAQPSDQADERRRFPPWSPQASYRCRCTRTVTDARRGRPIAIAGTERPPIPGVDGAPSCAWRECRPASSAVTALSCPRSPELAALTAHLALRPASPSTGRSTLL